MGKTHLATALGYAAFRTSTAMPILPPPSSIGFFIAPRRSS
jgi:hypothetical protein